MPRALEYDVGGFFRGNDQVAGRYQLTASGSGKPMDAGEHWLWNRLNRVH